MGKVSLSGNARSGELNPQSKLTVQKVQWIRRTMNHLSGAEQARELGVPARTIGDVRSGRTWSNATVIKRLGEVYKDFMDEGPCSGCELLEKCLTERLACAEFVTDVERNNAPIQLRRAATMGRIPTAAMYEYVFCGIDAEYMGERADGKPYYRSPERLKTLAAEAIRSIKEKLEEQ